MRISVFFIFVCCMHVGATGWSQTVSFTGKDVPLKTVFASLKKQTGYGVFFENGEAMLQSASPVTLDVKNLPLENFVRICLKDQPLDFSIEGKTIFIRSREAAAAIHATATESLSAGPGGQVKGRITNEKGEALVNANVIVKRTGRGAVTDANGSFVLHNVETTDVLTISFIGYKTQTIPVRDRGNLVLVMEAASNDLDKVVVQAYGNTTQRLATGNIVKVSAEDIARQPVANVLNAMQGLVPGAEITNTSGYSTAPIKVEIRGKINIGDMPSDPLYIVDGVPLTILDITHSATYESGSPGLIQSGLTGPAGGLSPLYAINPQDIESIEVLKDADATAIYGSRGANGVILITTKKAKVGKAEFETNFYEGYSQIVRNYHLLNTQQYLKIRKEAFQNDNLAPDQYTAPDLTLWDSSRFTDWQKFLWGKIGKTTDLHLSLSGGDQKLSFRLNGSYRYQRDMTAAKGGNHRATIGFNFSQKSANQRLIVNLTALYTYMLSDQINSPGGATLSPNVPAIWDASGNLNYQGWAPVQYEFPFGALLQTFNARTNFLNSNLSLEYHITKGLTVRTNLGYNTTNGRQLALTPIASQNPQYTRFGYSQYGYNYVHNIISEPQIEYTGLIGKGKINFLLGASSQINGTESNLFSGSGYTNDDLLRSLSFAPTQSTFNYYGEYRYAAVFSRLNYNLSNKILANVNVRRDGSSRFGPGKRFGNFGSIGIAYIFSEEPFFKKNLPFISFGKIRSSYGSTGSDVIGDYNFTTTWSPPRYTYNGTLPLVLNGHSDSLLHWEVNKKAEIALDLGFLHDAITFEIALYRNRCNNQLVQMPTANLTGFSFVYTNSPANVQNMGQEFTLNTKLGNKDFQWSMKFNLARNRNKLLSYPNLAQSPYASAYQIGKPLRIIRLLNYTGVDPQTGLYSFLDKNKDGQITIDYTNRSPDDRSIYDLSTRFDGGMVNSFKFKQWDFSFQLYFKKQIGINALSAIQPPGSTFTNAPVTALNHWQNPGDHAIFARLTTQPYDPSYFNYTQSSAIYTDASYIRLQNISIAYNFPEKQLTNAHLKNFRIYIQGQNIAVLTHYQGVDPEVQNFGQLPVSRIITAGLTCNL